MKEGGGSIKAVRILLITLLLCFVATASVGAADNKMSDELYISVITRYITVTNHASAGASDLIARTIFESCKRYGVDPLLMTSLIAQESRFRPDAVSRSGAMGLGQLMPATARMLGVADPYDIEQNIDGATRYLSQLLQRFANDDSPVTLAVAAYNAGPNAVGRYGGVPPYGETVNYLWRISENYAEIRSMLDG